MEAYGVNTPYKVIGDKQTTSNLRYKHGRNLNYEAKEVFAVRDPKEAGLPSPTVNSSFIFAKEDGYLCYRIITTITSIIIETHFSTEASVLKK
jgi:hypothetical protein